MTLFDRLARPLRRFRSDESGSYTVETVLALPLLVWGMMASLTYIDAYRTQIANLRITYSIADQIARLEKQTDSAYIDGLGRIYDYLAPADHDTFLRVTSILWDETGDAFVVMWSDVTQSNADASVPSPIDCSNFNLIEDQIPILQDGDTILFVETWLDYEPPFTIGIDPRRFDNDVAIAPRWTQIKHAGFPSNTCSIDAA